MSATESDFEYMSWHYTKKRDKIEKAIKSSEMLLLSKLLTTSEYQFAMDKYNADTVKQRERLEAAKNDMNDYIHSSTPANKWLVALSRFDGHEELTVDMTQELVERIEVFDGDKVSIDFKYQDEYVAVSAYVGVNDYVTSD